MIDLKHAALKLLISFFLLCCLATEAAEPMHFIYPPPENAADRRHAYYWELLEAALQATRKEYGDYTLTAYGTPMSFLRSVAEVEAGEKGRINIVSRATNLELETRMQAIPLPLDKGLLGYRLFLIMPENQARLNWVQTLDDLKQFTIGQGSSWADAKILADNQFKLVLTENYEGLFKMLGLRRFDLFSRGVNEIRAEWLAHKDQIPGLSIEKHLLLAYPLPRYFFVPRTPEGEKMAARIEAGLRALAKSGEFERRYRAYKKLVLADLNLSGRKIFRLHNSQLSNKAPPLSDKLWWDDLATELGTQRSSAESKWPWLSEDALKQRAEPAKPPKP